MEGDRLGRRNWNLEVTGEGKAGEDFSLCWDGSGRFPSGQMIPYGDTLIAGEAGKEWSAPPVRTLDRRKRGWVGFNK